MKRLFFIIAIIASATSLGICINKKENTHKEDITNLMLNDVESLTDLESWWNRPDYICVDVICQCILYSYDSTVALKVEDGKGTVAHQWNCTGCGDCGWTVKS